MKTKITLFEITKKEKDYLWPCGLGVDTDPYPEYIMFLSLHVKRIDGDETEINELGIGEYKYYQFSKRGGDKSNYKFFDKNIAVGDKLKVTYEEIFPKYFRPILFENYISTLEVIPSTESKKLISKSHEK